MFKSRSTRAPAREGTCGKGPGGCLRRCAGRGRGRGRGDHLRFLYGKAFACFWCSIERGIHEGISTREKSCEDDGVAEVYEIGSVQRAVRVLIQLVEKSADLFV